MAAKTRLELRIDNDVVLALKGLADELGVSVNQIMNGVARWAVRNAHTGTPFRQYGEIETIEQEGVVWFGRDGDPSARTRGDISNAYIAFVLDFSDGRALIDDPRPLEE